MEGFGRMNEEQRKEHAKNWAESNEWVPGEPEADMVDRMKQGIKKDFEILSNHAQNH